jgi:hypothetical protein
VTGEICSAYWKDEKEYTNLVRVLGEKITLGRPRCGYEYNTEIGLNVRDCGDVDLIPLAQDSEHW